MKFHFILTGYGYASFSNKHFKYYHNNQVATFLGSHKTYPSTAEYFGNQFSMLRAIDEYHSVRQTLDLRPNFYTSNWKVE